MSDIPPDVSQEKPFLLLTGGTHSGNTMRLLNFIQLRYHVELEYASDYEQVYALRPKLGDE